MNPSLFLFRWVIPVVFLLLSSVAIYFMVTSGPLSLVLLMDVDIATILVLVGYALGTLIVGYGISLLIFQWASSMRVALDATWLHSFLIFVGYPVVVVPLFLTLLSQGLTLFAGILLLLIVMRLALAGSYLKRGSFSNA